MDSPVNITLESIIQRKIIYHQNDTNEELLSMNAGYIRGFSQMLLDMELSESAFITKYLGIIEGLRSIFSCWNEHPKENVVIDRKLRGDIVSKDKYTICDECGSEFLKSSSKMMALCPECAHIIYGYPNCTHVFKNGRCIYCHWDGSQSEYIKWLKSDD